MGQATSKTKVASYRDLLVWQKGMELTKVIYTITKPFPGEENSG